MASKAISSARSRKPSTTVQGRGVISLSSRFLRDVLQLPGGYTILGAHFDASRDCWLIGVEHPCIPSADELERLPEVTPVYRAKQEEDGSVWRQLVDIKIEGYNDDEPSLDSEMPDENDRSGGNA